MESKACSVLGDHCGRQSLLESLEIVYLLSCNRDISRNRSTRVELKFFFKSVAAVFHKILLL